MSLRFGISGIGVTGAGLGGWAHCRRWLAEGTSPGEPEPPVSRLLSARERRRSPQTVRLALAAAEAACDMAGTAPDSLPGVFSSGMGDVDITDYMCGIVATSPALLSPTKFHNSVHNAAAGYWSIGAGTAADVTALCAYTDSFAAGLLEAALRCATTGQPVLLVSYDLPARGLLRQVWPVEQPFAGALVLSPPAASSAGPAFELRFSSAPESLPALPPDLDTLARDNPAARLLYLLALIDGGDRRELVIAPEQGPRLAVCRQ